MPRSPLVPDVNHLSDIENRNNIENRSACNVWFLQYYLLLSEDWHLKEVMKTFGRPETLKKIFSKLFQATFKKNEDAMLLVTGVAILSQIANHCQI